MPRGRPRKTVAVKPKPEVIETEQSVTASDESSTDDESPVIASDKPTETVEPEVTETEQSVTASDESPTDSDKPSPAVVPATFEMVGRFLTCTVCGTRASADIDRKLFCFNLHNHPLMEESNG
ncbi:hypothetical protein Lepto7375DRAFT_7291 [Leptolyngbya sp. PCC 7375]|nr:hypothetical protein Lepto7375DRAFT_7291 [Leptolyngbya sp. PCC 7375]